MDRKRLFSSTKYWMVAITLGLCVSSLGKENSETSQEATQHFQKANELQILADTDAAIAEYQTVIKLSPSSKIAQNAQYWIGQLYFESNRYDAALTAFQTLLDEYPASRTIPATKTMMERVQQAKKNKSLFEAVKKGDIEQVKLLISEGADINGRDPNAQSALNLAVAGGHKDMVELIIEKGADINGKGRYDATPLHDAAWLGQKEIAELLIGKGADVNILQNNVDGTKGWTPLHSACSQDHADVAELLVANGADVNAEDEGGDTPLYYAVDVNNLGLVKILVEAGADINAGRWPPLGKAVSEDNMPIGRYLIDHGANVNATKTWTPLQEAATFSREWVEFLLANGANIKGGTDQPTLHAGIRSGHPDIVKLLIERGVDIHAKDAEGRTPLQRAAKAGRT